MHTCGVMSWWDDINSDEGEIDDELRVFIFRPKVIPWHPNIERVMAKQRKVERDIHLLMRNQACTKEQEQERHGQAPNANWLPQSLYDMEWLKAQTKSQCTGC